MNKTAFAAGLSILVAATACGDDTAEGTGGGSEGGGTSTSASTSSAQSGSTASAGGGTSSSSGEGAGGGAGGGDGAAAAFPDPVDADQVARAAVFIASCVPDDEIEQYVQRFLYRRSVLPFDRFQAERAACFQDRTDGCAAVEQCLGIAFDRTGPCETSCDGDVLTACDDEWKFQIDCSAPGLTCDPESGACVDATAPACDAETFVDTCDEGAPLGCADDRELHGFDCADLGLTCSAEDDFVTCQGAGAECFSETSSTFGLDVREGIACEGDALRACVANGEHLVDCASIATGFTCQTDGDRAFCGVAAECDGDMEATCDGDSISTCVGGRIETVDCRELGFDGCDPERNRCFPGWF